MWKDNKELVVYVIVIAGNYVEFDPDNVKVYRDIKIIWMPTLEEEMEESVYVMSARHHMSRKPGRTKLLIFGMQDLDMSVTRD